MKIRSIIIEDEPKNIRVLSNLIKDNCPSVAISGVAEDIHQGKSMIDSLKPDLVFLDIEMPHGNAFEMLNNFEVIDFKIIFITAYNAYAVKAFKYAAIDYLLKPVDIDELKRAVDKVVLDNADVKVDVKIKELLSQIKLHNHDSARIAIPTLEGLIFINDSDVIRCEASLSYTIIYTTHNQKIISSKNISEYEEILSSNKFFRIHKSHIVNINKISRYVKGRGGYVVMEDGTSIEVASRRKEEFLSIFL